MNGPDHYLESERLARQAARVDDSAAALVMATLSVAHATLANAAATALSEPSRSAPRATVPEWDHWQHVAGVRADGGEGK